MKDIKFDRLTTDVKLIALAKIEQHVKKTLDTEGITPESVPEDYFKAVSKYKLSRSIIQFRFTEDGSILEESTHDTKGVLDYEREQ